MKKLALLIVAAAFASNCLAADPLDALRRYASGACPSCPDAKITLKPIPGVGPANFSTYELLVDSKDETCKTHRFLLYSPTTQQVIVGMVVLLPQDNRPVDVRVTDQIGQMTHSKMSASVSAFPLPDGLKGTQVTRPTEYGPFAYNGWVDASERFLILGLRGSLNIPPARTLRELLRVDQLAVHRGNPKAKLEVIELSDFECPSCARTHKKLEPLIAANLSKINFARIDFPLFEHHEWAVSAALGARAIAKVAPSHYWAYADFLFTNQEAVGKQPFDKVLQNFCEDHDIPWEKIKPIYSSPAERQSIMDEVGRAFDAGLNGTPTFIINGQIVAYGTDASNIVDAIRHGVGAK